MRVLGNVSILKELSLLHPCEKWLVYLLIYSWVISSNVRTSSFLFFVTSVICRVEVMQHLAHITPVELGRKAHQSRTPSSLLTLVSSAWSPSLIPCVARKAMSSARNVYSSACSLRRKTFKGYAFPLLILWYLFCLDSIYLVCVFNCS